MNVEGKPIELHDSSDSSAHRCSLMTDRFEDLQPGQVHVWRAELGAGDAWQSLLSPDEQARADRLVGPEPRRRFLAARGILRSLLSRYLRNEPDAIAFRYGARGKPELANSNLRFNLAHSNDLAVYAVTRDGEVGIDVEAIRPLPDLEDLACRYFSPREADRLLRLPAAERAVAFFHCWVRKEAYLKGLGQGLSVPADQVETWPGPPPSGALMDLDPRPGFVAALAIERPDLSVACWQWPPECG
jgi:4'-phosphopantetheinyl transferase